MSSCDYSLNFDLDILNEKKMDSSLSLLPINAGCWSTSGSETNCCMHQLTIPQSFQVMQWRRVTGCESITGSEINCSIHHLTIPPNFLGNAVETCDRVREYNCGATSQMCIPIEKACDGKNDCGRYVFGLVCVTNYFVLFSKLYIILVVGYRNYR